MKGRHDAQPLRRNVFARTAAVFFVGVTLFGSGCRRPESRADARAESITAADALPPPPPPAPAASAAAPVAASRPGEGGATGGRDEAPTLAAAAEAGQRRVIRNADLTLEVADGAAAQQRAATLAEGAGGFIVSSDAQHMGAGGRPYLHVTVVARVPAARFVPTLDEMRRLGARVLAEKVTGQDVTEEFVDLEARLRVQRAFEQQLLALLREAKSVQDSLEVHQQLAQVRSEIERVEGRRRYLVNQTDLSTITLRLHEPTPFAPAVGGDGFGVQFKRALADAVEASAGVVLFLVRALGVLAPLAALVGLPMTLFVRHWARRRRARRASLVAARPLGAEAGS
jgi:hypothetical protein